MGGGANPDFNLRRFNVEVQAEYKSMGIFTNRYQTIKRTMVHPSGRKLPLLKGRGLQVKNVGPVLLRLCERYFNMSDPIHTLIIDGLRQSIHVETILSKCSDEYKLPAADAAELNQCIIEFCRINCTCVRHFHYQEPSVNLFAYTMKSHSVMHIGILSKWINPSLGTCYSGETLMPICKKLVRSSASANSPQMASRNAMITYVRGFELSILPQK